ncbi:hypothetical protein [Mariniphaga sediminis]|uniref:hypothetical protein n=1 Tax=Mariniphaga sediminis TaxID=1628158 RepID=UPI001559D741|nr:hypothetical protein [Mariniphaga sediminis]
MFLRIPSVPGAWLIFYFFQYFSVEITCHTSFDDSCYVAENGFEMPDKMATLLVLCK